MPIEGEHKTNLLNVLMFALSSPKRAVVLGHKIVKRLKDGHGKYSEADNLKWIDDNSMSSKEIAQRLAPELWDEAVEFGRRTRARAEPILAEVPVDMGAGGDYEFLYWLTRYLRPAQIVETGVSAGWTSQAFLSALRQNGSGQLHSSDFPYFRIKDPEQYIGVIVEPELRKNWDLHTVGDEIAIPEILSKVEQVDLLHYDSDKSFSGRASTMALVRQRLAPGGIMIMDDIRNDSWFREYVEAEKVPFTVFNGRYGLIGELKAPGA